MKIVFVAPGLNLSGGTRVIATYADRLRARGHDVLVLAGRPPRPGLRGMTHRALRGERFWEGRRKPSHFDDMETELRLAARPGPVTAADIPQADAIVATWWRTAVTVAGLPPSRGAKFYLVQHHEVHESQPEQEVRASYRLPLHKVTVSRWLADMMRDEYGDPDVTLIRNSVDLEHFQSPPRERGQPPTVGFMYSPRPYKGVPVILQAIERARARVPDLRVVSFGERVAAGQESLLEGVRFVLRPDQAAIPGLYGQCDAWMFGSSLEGFGLPILEAMACRCPVVATRAGCAPDVIEDGVNGYLAPIGDAQTLGDRLADLLSLPPAAWRRMSDAANATVREHSWDDAAAAFEACLDRIVRRERADA
jgi:glycosyltransferase involved in cell wall biosynthesis